MRKHYNIIIVFSVFGLVLLLVGVTYSFFNYTRTGGANNLGTGSISFNTTEGTALSLTNIFPMTSEEAEEASLASVTLGITGSTTYASGEEYLISLVDVNNTINNKKIPITFMATYEETTGNSIGTSTDNYFEAEKNANMYKLNSTGSVIEDKQVLVGFIKGGTSGISGTLTISAYIDADRIAISDTYYENATATPTPTAPNDEYGTTTEWVDGRTVLTTSEWNSLTSNPISFKIRAESNEGLWVEEPEADNVSPASCFDYSGVKIYTVNTNMTQTELNDCISYFNGLNITFDNNGTAEGYCLGTAKKDGWTFQADMDNGIYASTVINYNYGYLTEHNIITDEVGVQITGYNSSCGGNVVIPNRLNYSRLMLNSNMTSEELNTCVTFLSTQGWDTSYLNGSLMDFCAGTATRSNSGRNFQDLLDFNGFIEEDIEYLINQNIVLAGENMKYPVLSVHQYGGIFERNFILTNLTLNNNLKIIGSNAFSYISIIPELNILTIPQNVRYIGDRAMIFDYSDKNNFDETRNLEYNFLGKTFIGDITLNIMYSGQAANNGGVTVRYNGTCDELHFNTANYYSGKSYIMNGADNAEWDAITTDTNYCKVYSASGGD